MAITDAGKWGEYAGATNPKTIVINGGANIKAGSLIVVYFGGHSPTTALLGMSKVTDSQGNTYQIKQFQSSYRAAGIAIARTGVALEEDVDWLKFQWNRTPEGAWISIHAFEGADSVWVDSRSANGSGTAFNSTLDTPSGDWLLLETVTFPYEASPSTTLTGSTVRQDNITGPPSSEGYSLIGSGAGTATVGASLSSSATYGLVAIAVGGKAMPVTPTRVLGGFMGI